MIEPWNSMAAVDAMATVQKAQETKRIHLNHPKIEPIKVAVMGHWRSQDLTRLRDACAVAVTAIANLPLGTYDHDAAAMRASLDRAVEKKRPTVLPIRETPMKA
jgi:hypothetical protein